MHTDHHHSTLPRPHHSRHQINLRLERWHRHWLYAVCALLWASGAAWVLARYFLRPVGEFGETVHPIEPWAMKLHGGAAMVMLFFFGSLLNAHIRRAIKSGRNLGTGWSMIVAMLLLIASGFGLYYLAGESDRYIWSAGHWVVGLAFGALVVLHIVLGRRGR